MNKSKIDYACDIVFYTFKSIYVEVFSFDE
jgi:hypothetical protein